EDNDDTSDDDVPYPVGYGRPPRHARFKPGQSGNPTGRRRGSRNLSSEMQKVLMDRIPVSTGGKRRKVPAIVALHRLTLNRGLKGDHRAVATMFKSKKDLGLLDEARLPEPSVGDFLPTEILQELSDATLLDLRRAVKRLIENSRTKKTE